MIINSSKELRSFDLWDTSYDAITEVPLLKTQKHRSQKTKNRYEEFWRFIKMQTLKLEILSEKYMFPVGFEPTYPL